MSELVKKLVKRPTAQVFRRAQIKRRSTVTGLFESSWFDISKDVKSYGKVSSQIDATRRNQFTFGNAKLVMENDSGRYNPHDSQSSTWYGFLNQQRTLVRIQVGFKDPVLNSNGVWAINESPSPSYWDEALWDVDTSLWDDEISSTVFTGVISGDISLSDSNDVHLNVRPLNSVFQDYPARNLTGWTSTGMTASKFVEMVRDQQDGSGNYIFRPFFGDTTSGFDISATANVFSNLNTSTAADVIDKTVWQVIEKLSEAENFVPYVSRDGVFKFISRGSVSPTQAYQFHGAGSFSQEYGQTIKSVTNYGFKVSKYYSRVQVKFREDDTATSYVVVESALTVSPGSNPWVLGNRTLAIENTYIPNTTTAQALATEIFNDVTSLKREIEIKTSLVPHLEIFDRFSIFYSPSQFFKSTLWDQNDWAADVTQTDQDLIFDKADGDAILLEGQEFKFLSFEIDIDNLENKFIAREI